MIDQGSCEDEAATNEERSTSQSPIQTDVDELKRKLKAPDSRRFERELEKLTAKIREKEARFSFLKSSRNTVGNHANKDRETLMAELRGYKTEREEQIERRKKIDQELKAANLLVQQKNDACAKLQAGLKYKIEAKADEAIRRLEHQMRVQQLKLREEKRIVTEIDSLKRSKKSIREFDALKHEISQLREKQHSLRTQRDGCMKAITALKSNEEQTKNALDEQRHQADKVRNQQKEYINEKSTVKKDIDDLYQKKRELVTTYNKEKDEYYSILRDIRLQERQTKKDMEFVMRSEERHDKQPSDVRQQGLAHTSHKRSIGLCDTLITYLERMNVNNKPDMDDSSVHEQQNEENPDAAASFSGGAFLKKKSDDDLEAMYGGAKKNTRRSRKGRKSNQKESSIPKKLVHHAHVLEQFIALNLTPPSSSADISRTLDLLQEKKDILIALLASSQDMNIGSSSSSLSSSHEDFPSLPPPQPHEQAVSISVSSNTDTTQAHVNGTTPVDTETSDVLEQQGESELTVQQTQHCVQTSQSVSTVDDSELNSVENENSNSEDDEAHNNLDAIKEGPSENDAKQENGLEDNGNLYSVNQEDLIYNNKNSEDRKIEQSQNCDEFIKSQTVLKDSLEVLRENNEDYDSNINEDMSLINYKNFGAKDSQDCSRDILAKQNNENTDQAVKCPS